MQLIEMSLEEMEMPGQHLPAPDAPDTVHTAFSPWVYASTPVSCIAHILQVHVDRLGSTVGVVRRNCSSCRRIFLHGSDGSLRSFLVQNSQVRFTYEQTISLKACVKQACFEIVKLCPPAYFLCSVDSPFLQLPD